MDILWTRVNGTMKCTPGGSALGDTLPNRSFTPTCPAGTTVIGPPITTSTKSTSAMIARRTNRGPGPAGGTISKVLPDIDVLLSPKASSGGYADSGQGGVNPRRA